MNISNESIITNTLDCIVVINHSSGSNSKEDLINKIESVLIENAIPFEFFIIDAETNFLTQCTNAVSKAKATKKVIIAVGGDGTVNALARLCYQNKIYLGIVPTGTFNYFAKNLHIPLDSIEAVKVICQNNLTQVTIGKLGDKLFVNNASFGLYKKLIELREHDKSIYGRRRIVAFFSAIKAFLKYQKNFTINIKINEKLRTITTTMVFIGINSFQLSNIGLPISKSTENNKFAILILKSVNFFQSMFLMFSALIGKLELNKNIEHLNADNLKVVSRRSKVDVVLDGEVVSCATPLEFEVLPDALKVFVPLPEQE
jgi:diacylglycerol kinase family enzyme